MINHKEAKKAPDLSVIIPVLFEAQGINPLITHIHRQRTDKAFEIIVVDGDPRQSTIKKIMDPQVRAVSSPAGRAKQMNLGASVASGEILLFLHADTLLPYDALDRICAVMDRKDYVGGAFDLGIGSERFIYHFISYPASIRSRLTRIPYGDQAIFIRRNYFNRIGGYQDIPLMEDVELMRRIRKRGDRIFIIRERVITSPRRWEKEGIIRGTIRNWLIMSLYFMGVSPYRLSKFYKT
ncbi:MAG: TIGR04283 family arsenosugar biosynthesis glycosyltransferase [bacterium]